MTTVFEQLPPHDVQAEESIIASLMVDDEAAVKVASVVTARDFFREANAWTFAAEMALFDRGEAINQVSVAHELERQGCLDEVGGLSFLSDLVLNLPTPVGVEHFAAMVKRDATYRQMISVGMAIVQNAYNAGPDIDAAVSQAEKLVYNLRAEGKSSDFVHIRDYLAPVIDTPHDPAVDGFVPYSGRVRSGFGSLDTLLGGFNPSDLFIVAARTGVGKTALMLNFARNAAMDPREPARVAVFSLEMAGDQLAMRLLAAEARIDSAKLRLGLMSEVEEARMMHGHGLLSGAEIYIDDSSAIQVPELRAKCLRLQRDHGLDLVLIDYLQLVKGGKTENRVQELSAITRELKQLARELDVPIVAGSQLSRGVEQRNPHIPMLSDLRESGSIEQDADIVLFIYREDMYMRRDEWEALHPDPVREPYPAGKAQLIVAKHRNGPTGVVEVRFRSEYSKFEDVDVPAGEPLR